MYMKRYLIVGPLNELCIQTSPAKNKILPFRTNACLCIVSQVSGTTGARIGILWRSWVVLSSLASALALERSEGNSSQTISSPSVSTQCCRPLWFQHRTSHCSTSCKLKCSAWTVCCEVAHARGAALGSLSATTCSEVLIYTRKLRCCRMPNTL